MAAVQKISHVGAKNARSAKKKPKFRFVEGEEFRRYGEGVGTECAGGGAAERDQTKPLWFLQHYRRLRVSFEIVCVIGRTGVNACLACGCFQGEV